MSRRRPYGLGRFMADIFLGIITGGLYWMYLLFKFIRV